MKTPSHSRICSEGGEGAFIHIPSNYIGLRDISHTRSMPVDAMKSVFGRQQSLEFHILFIINTSLQNVTDIVTKYNSFFIT